MIEAGTLGVVCEDHAEHDDENCAASQQSASPPAGGRSQQGRPSRSGMASAPVLATDASLSG